MDKNFINALYEKHSNVVFGCLFTKHFFERLMTRCQISDFEKIIRNLDSQVCMIIYRMVSSNFDSISHRIGNITVVLKLETTNDHPVLVAKTVYKT